MRVATVVLAASTLPTCNPVGNVSLLDDTSAHGVPPLIEEDYEVSPGCDEPVQGALRRTGHSKLRIAAYNVENLFDVEHDQGKQDFDYMPVGDPEKVEGCRSYENEARIESCLQRHWDDQYLERKLDQLEESFRIQYGTRRNFPEILVLSEVENAKVAAMLGHRLGYTGRPRHVADQSADYRALLRDGSKACTDWGVSGLAMTNSPDRRGIDIAILYKSSSDLEAVACHEYYVDLARDSYTRNILAVEFVVGGSHRVLVTGHHWPSQRGPTELRIAAARTTRSVIEEARRRGLPVVALGDFNSLDDEHPNPIGEMGDLIDLSKAHERNANDRGTYFYIPKAVWNDLDRVLVTPELTDPDSGMKIVNDSFVVHRQVELFRAKNATFYRDDATADLVEEMTGVPLRYRNLAADLLDAGAQSRFEERAELQALNVSEACAPQRFYATADDDGLVSSGFSDHFAVSAVLDFRTR